MNIISFSGLLTLTVLLSMVPLTAVTVSAADAVRNETALIKAIGKGKDVSLGTNIKLTNTLTIPKGVTVSLDLNGKTLDRGLDGEVQENGSVILVEEGAALTVKDNSGNNAGVITGGASYYGGGICNYGTLTLQAGTVKGNSAVEDTYGGGGGIYNGGTLELTGGVIRENEARYGGGIVNETGKTMTVKERVYEKQIGANTTEIPVNVTVTENYADDGKSHGICNNGTINIQDAPAISNNGGGENDLYISYGKKLNVTGELRNTKKINVMSAGTNPVITTGYSTCNTKSPDHFFSVPDHSAVVQLSSAANGEVMLKTDTKTTVIVYQNDKITKREEYDSPDKAWSKVNEYGKQTDQNVRVEVTLGSDYPKQRDPIVIGKDIYVIGNDVTFTFKVEENRNVVLDLNGHYLKRDGSKDPNGSVFEIAKDATLTIRDSKPNAKGYDGIRGGVIAGGLGRGIVVRRGATLKMLGGTLYQCTYKGTGEAGGAAVCVSEGNEKSGFTTVQMKDCAVKDCVTTGNTNGGAIYINCPDNANRYHATTTLENVTVTGCHAGNDGGVLYMTGAPGTVSLKNCLFSNNTAGGRGGVLCAYDLTTSSNVRKWISVFYLKTENCTFQKNAAKDGGAVYIEATTASDLDKVFRYRETQNPIVFKNCTMKNNAADNAGSALTLNQCETGVVLYGGTITNNTKCDEAICVKYGNSLSLAGKLVIRDNQTANNATATGISTRGVELNSLYCAGLKEGSYVDVGRPGKKVFVHQVSEYQKRYFHSPDSDLQLTETERKNAKLVTASAFGNGSVLAVTILLALVAAGGLAAVIAIIKIRKKKGDDIHVDQ